MIRERLKQIAHFLTVKRSFLGRGIREDQAVNQWDLWSVLYRSFFLQATWNTQRQQNIGWLFSFWPIIRRVHANPEYRSRFSVEHLESFNTNPYLSNFILGVAAGLEEERRHYGTVKREQIAASKKFMSGPLAALGDSFFGGTLVPFLGVMSIFVGYVTFRNWWLTVLIFLGLFNLVHLTVRFGGVWIGYHLKAQVVSFLMRLNLQGLVQRTVALGVLVCTVSILVLLFSQTSDVALGFFSVPVTIICLRLKVRPWQIFYGVILIAIALNS